MAVLVCSMMCLPALQTGRSRGFAFVYFKDLDDTMDVSDNSGECEGCRVGECLRGAGWVSA